MSKCKVNVGIDIGTKFCYAGFIGSNGEFISLVDDNTLEDGIPAQVIYIDERLGFRCGSDAEQWEERNPRSEYYFLPSSLKTLIRDHMGNIECDIKLESSTRYGQTKDFPLSQLVNQFVKYLCDKILLFFNDQYASEYEISSITFGFPDLPTSSEYESSEMYQRQKTYEGFMARTIERILSGIDPHLKPQIYGYTESTIAGDLMRVIADANPDADFKCRIITIDIGAGTTDICLLTTDIGRDGRKRYNSKYIVSHNFGGDQVDTFLCNKGLTRATRIAIFKNMKALLFDRQRYNDPSCDPIWSIAENTNLRDYLTSERGINYGRVETDFKNSCGGSWGSVLRSIEATKNYQISQHGDREISFILMGGSSQLSFIKNDIEFAFAGSGASFNIKSIVDVGGRYGITNSNFIAYGASLYNPSEGKVRSIKPIDLHRETSSSASTTTNSLPATKYCSYTYGIKAADANGYYVIVKRGFSDSPEVEYTSDPFQMMNGKRVMREMRPKDYIVRINIRPNTSDDIESFVSVNDCDAVTYIKTDKIITLPPEPILFKSVYRYNSPINQQLEIKMLDTHDRLIVTIFDDGSIIENQNSSKRRKIFW